MSFGRFLDSWVVDRVMFEFVSQGGCSCCGMQHGSLGTDELMAMCSDVETDDGKTEKLSPWPKNMVEEVWADRVKFRRRMKQDLPTYRAKFDQFGEEFTEWWKGLTPKGRKRCFMMPKEELVVQFDTKFDFKAQYKIVLDTVIEQVKQFDATGYNSDGATDAEIILEGVLVVKRGAWTVDPAYYETDAGVKYFLGMIKQLGGDHLLPKRSQEIRDQAEEARTLAESGEASDEEEKCVTNEKGQTTQNFRGDRRLVRLVIFRYFADQCWTKFERYRKENKAMCAEITEDLSQKVSSLKFQDAQKSKTETQSMLERVE